MSSRLYQIASGNQSAALTSDVPKIATGTTLKALLQVAPAVGFEVVEWGISFDGSAAATPGQVELVEVDVAASSGTASYVPVNTVNTAISSSATTTLVLNAAIQGTAATFQVGTYAVGGAAGGGEQMQVTGGGGSSSLTVVRGVNDTTALASIPANTIVYGLPGTGVYSDVIPLSAQPAADPLYALLCNTGTGATGFNFTTYNSPTRVRTLDMQLLPPTAPYVKQFPLERGPQLNPGRFLQVRCTFGTTINAYCYVIVAA